ncbi:archaemetzincin family Zn-dependent metalloprotease [Vulcanisaeta thermophila]|uniref:archaemetzincin family Zn-dependent metalloprotease n=1 Tax=Vulcanisaeta thermophila TaxID=867917 RepID=UPI0008533CBF|nr:archaemetzincin family Zn-dependent metalloprotease [Vulcanisaeta thermophila]
MLRILILTEIDLPPEITGLVSKYLDGVPQVEVRKTDFEGLKSQFRDPRRGQVKADELLDYLEPRVRDYGDYDRIVLVIDGDGYVEGMNFVFGVARMNGKLAIIFTQRLVTNDVSLFHSRVLKEILHELGHTFGLDHCLDPTCVMHFSNTVHDTDTKGPGFCPRCLLKLRRNMVIR